MVRKYERTITGKIILLTYFKILMTFESQHSVNPTKSARKVVSDTPQSRNSNLFDCSVGPACSNAS